MLLFTSLSTVVYSSCALALTALVRLLFSTVFLSLPCFQLVDGVGRDPFLVLGLLLAKDLFTCVLPELLAVFPLCFQCLSHCLLSALVAVGTCWKGWIWKAACVSLSLSSPTLYFVRVLLVVVNLLRRSFTVVIRRWWSDDHVSTSHHSYILPWSPELAASAILWSIWFSVTWFEDIHVALWMRLCGKMLPPIHQLVQGTQVCKALTIFIHLSQSMCPHDVLVSRVVHSNLGVEISHLLKQKLQIRLKCYLTKS